MATSANFPAEHLGFGGKPAPLVVRKSQPSPTDLLSQNSVFLDQIFNDLLLPLNQPSSNGNN